MSNRGNAIVRMMTEAIAAGGASTLAGREPFEAKDVFDAARTGDDLAKSVIDQMARFLGFGIVSLVHTVDPEVVAIGGGVAESADLFMDRVREVVNERVFPAAGGALRIETARLGDDAGITGVAAQVLETNS